MFIHCKLVILILALTLDGQVHTGEILRNYEAVPHSRPYMAILESYMQDGKIKYCGAFLLNEDFVMTAAHCQARSYTVLLGVHKFHSKEIHRISVEQAFPHRDYNATDFRNDIMVLKLSSKANLSRNVQPIDLAAKDDGCLPKSCLISGWGLTDNSKYMSPVLMEVNLTLTDNEKCAKENMYCSEGEIGPARGDGGGPLVCEDGKAYGVVSSSIRTHPGSPQICRYTKIPYFRSWIDLFMTALKSFNTCHI